MPERRKEECHIHGTQQVVDGCDQKGVAGKEESGRRQRRILWKRNLVRGRFRSNMEAPEMKTLDMGALWMDWIVERKKTESHKNEWIEK